MASTDTHRAKELFLDAIELSAEERASFLARLEADDPELHGRVKRLLDAHSGDAGAELESLPARIGGALLEHDDHPGEVLGDYELIEEIASGASGVVWRARQTSLGRTVAVKVLRAGRFAGTKEVDRFRAEAESIARLEHPHIVPVYEVGAHEGRPFFSMRLLEGGSLYEHIGRLDPKRSARIVATVARAVHHAHQRGLLHRDLKPSNVLLDEEGEPHVADFGVAKRIDAAATATGTLGVAGTPAYMAPEQTELGGELTVTTDVWALGCILYELLAGRPPFAADTTTDVLRKVRDESPFPLRALAPDAPRDLETIALTCLRKDAGRRYGSANALAFDLESWLRHEPIQARRTSLPERLYLYWLRSPLVATLVAAVFLLAIALAIGFRWANVELQARLRDAYVEQARATRRSEDPGRRTKALDLLAQAAAIRPGDDVRDEAIASLALTDLSPRVAHEKVLSPMSFDARLEHTLSVEQGRPPRVHLVRVADGESLRTFSTPSTPASGYFSPTGEHVLIRCYAHGDQLDDPSITLFDAATGAERWSHDVAVSFKSVSFDADGERVAAGLHDGTAPVYDVETGAELFRIEMGARSGDLEFHPGGDVIALGVGGGLNLVQIRSLPSGELLYEHELPRSPYEVVWLADGRLAVACSDFHSYVLDVDGGGDPLVLEGHGAEVVGLHASPTAPLVATNSWDGSVRLWHTVTGSQVFSSVGTTGLRFSADGTGFGWFDRDTYGVWGVEFGGILRTLHGHTGKDPRRAMFARDSQHLISIGGDGAKLWDAEAGVLLRELTDEHVTTALYPPDGERFLLSGDEGLVEYRFDDPGHRAIIVEGDFSDADMSADGRIAAMRSSGKVRIVDFSDLSRDVSFTGPVGVNTIEVTPDGGRVVAGTWQGHGFTVWDAATGELEQEMLPDVEGVRVILSPDGELLLTGADRWYIIYRVGTWEEVRRFERATGSAGPAGGFSPDGTVIAINDLPNRFSLLEVATGRRVATLEDPLRDRPGRLEFSPNGKYLSATAGVNKVNLWDLDAMWRELERLELTGEAR